VKRGCDLLRPEQKDRSLRQLLQEAGSVSESGKIGPWVNPSFMTIAEDQLQVIPCEGNSITRRRKAQRSLLEQNGRSKNKAYRSSPF